MASLVYCLQIIHFFYIPTKLNIKVLVTSDDVCILGSIPAFGIKIDCVPGSFKWS